MARKQTGLAEYLFDMLVQMPWWAGVSAAVVFWIIGVVRYGGAQDGGVSAGLAPLLRMVFNGLAILSLAAAGASAIKRVSRRKLLDRQKGIDSLRSLSWQQFEQLVGEAYRRRGYDIEERGGGGADGGVDLVLRGQGETVLVQCKRWKTQQVGVDKVRELFGVVTAERADRGILVTSGHFTRPAIAFATGKAIELVDGPALAKLVQDVQPTQSPLVEESVLQPSPALVECPTCGSDMILRTAKRGANAGSQFYGCSQYPKCRGTRAVHE